MKEYNCDGVFLRHLEPHIPSDFYPIGNYKSLSLAKSDLLLKHAQLKKDPVLAQRRAFSP